MLIEIGNTYMNAVNVDKGVFMHLRIFEFEFKNF